MKVDPYSTGVYFDGWAERDEHFRFLWNRPATYDPLFVFEPQTWFLKTGWKKYSRVSLFEVPTKPI